MGESDGELQISLNEGHGPTADYVNRLRDELPRRFPGMGFSFLPADIVSQILNFGAPAPIDLQIRGNDLGADYAYANKLLAQIRQITGVADARIQQSAALPTLDVNIDRTRAQYTGVTAADVTNSLVVNLAGSSQVAPVYWLNEKNCVTYPIALQTPQYQIDTLPALPAALAGIIWMLFATHPTLSVPALTGAIMCMGVATANSVLVISFAREKLTAIGDATQAALEAGFVRLRPVLMTALAMVIGMLPMALGMGEGGEQNAPLGRAVIGGLIFATVSTLFFVPVVFSIIHRHDGPKPLPEANFGGTDVPA